MQIIVRPSWSKYLLHVADILVISPSAQAKKHLNTSKGAVGQGYRVDA